MLAFFTTIFLLIHNRLKLFRRSLYLRTNDLIHLPTSVLFIPLTSIASKPQPRTPL